MSRKKRILLLGEASFLNTGFSIYGKEILSRLYLSKKYEIAELGAYGNANDPRRLDLPWTYYSNLPIDKNEEANYISDPANQWGLWRLEETLLDFKPDIVFDVRDWWMLEFTERSPFRNLFHWAIMPTIDSMPQREQWLATYINADSICAYSEFGRDTMLKETNGRVKFVDLAPPAADYSIFKPTPNKRELREFMGLEPDINIIGTVMRNQKRKLYPELIQAFARFLREHPIIGKDTFLYLHTAFPDVGWDIPRLIRESGVGHKILFTYLCTACKHTFTSFFQDSTQICPRCRKYTARMPTSDFGVDNKQLADIINCFDIYVQYAICEGFGMPQVEAAACGVPIMAVNYSAMESIVKNLRGIPIKVKILFREAETHSFRAYPDEEDFVEKLAHFLSKDTSQRQQAGKNTYNLCRQHYSYDKSAKIWMDIFDNVPIRPLGETWNKPPRIIQPNMTVPANLTNEQFVRWCIVNIWGEPDKINSYIGLRVVRDLNYGQAMSGNIGIFYDEESAINNNTRLMPFTRDHVIQTFYKLAEQRNRWEQRRTGLLKEEPAGFIKQAHRESKE